MKIKVNSLNIEGKRHLKKVFGWIRDEGADLVCLMEVCEEDVQSLSGEVYPYTAFAKNDVLGNNRWEGESNKSIGVAILSKHKIVSFERIYCGRPPRTEIVPPGTSTHAPILLLATIQVGTTLFSVGAVHFTWTKDGSVSDEQRSDLDTLMAKLDQQELVMIGDFNFSRGGELYKVMASKYRDNLPAEVETTLDPKLHYANLKKEGSLKLVVDYIWSTPTYQVSGVGVRSGVSDHCGLSCQIAKN